MSTPTHILTGLFLGLSTVNIFETPINSLIVVIISILFAQLPDINVLWHSSLKSHHDDFTHYPLFWLLVIPIIAFIETQILSSTYFSSLLVVNIFLHLIADTFGYYIAVKWLWPFSQKHFSFTPLRDEVMPGSFGEWLFKYIQSSYKWIEIGWVSFFFMAFLISKFVV